MNNLPIRLHIGTQKAGSTYLYNLLASHKDITLSGHTEVNFFSQHYKKGVAWYAGVFRQGENVIDISPTYFKHGGEVAGRVAKEYGDKARDLRFVLILRNPIDYLFSHWHMHRMHGYFETQHKLYPEVPDDVVLFVECYPQYLQRAEYDTLLNEWTEYFSKDQFKIVVFEDFVKNTDVVMRNILQFWDIPYEKLQAEQASKNKALRLQFLHSLRGWVVRHKNLKRTLKKSSLFNVLLENVLTKETSIELTSAGRKKIKELLANNVQHLAGEYGVDISWWKDFSHIVK